MYILFPNKELNKLLYNITKTINLEMTYIPY